MARVLPLHGAWTTMALLCLASNSSAQRPFFTDATVSAGLVATPTSCTDSVPGSEMVPGAAAGDFDNDGWQDLFVLGGNLVPDSLFINNGDGTFTDEAALWGVDKTHRGRGVCVADYDGDGWLDIFITSAGQGFKAQVGKHKLWHNEGNRSFRKRAVYAGVNTTSPVLVSGMGCCFGDYDLDGDLDLMVAGWWKYPFASNPEGNRLFQNDGDGTFTDVTSSALPGINENSNQVFDTDSDHAKHAHGFSPVFLDMNGDRYPELLITGDFGTSRYYINNGDGTFSDGTTAAVVNLETNGMGSTTGDFNNDGYVDWYVTSSIDNNKLYIYDEEQGDHFFEVSRSPGVADGSWGWGTVATDVDRDGWLDIVETNGWTGTQGCLPAKLWLNGGDLTFSEATGERALMEPHQGLGMLRIDYDEDGDEDIIVTGHERGGLRLFRNDHVTRNHWLRVVLDTSPPPGILAPVAAPNGVGSTVKILTSEGRQIRVLDAGCHYLSTSELVLTFGLGDAKLIDVLKVYWNDRTGATTTLRAVAVDQKITIKSY